jgi:hypothetical protein
MDNQPPVRKKWSERQFELFVNSARELGQGVTKADFERVVGLILPAEEQVDRPAPGCGRKSKSNE